MKNQLVVKDAMGKDQKIDVLDIVEDRETGKKYMFYHLPAREEIYAAILKESDSAYVLEAITEDNEWDLVEQILENQGRLAGGVHE